MWALGAWLKRLQFASMTRWGRRKGRVSPCRDSANESCDLKELWLVTLGKVRLALGNISKPRGTQKCGNSEKSLLDQENVYYSCVCSLCKSSLLYKCICLQRPHSQKDYSKMWEDCMGKATLYSVVTLASWIVKSPGGDTWYVFMFCVCALLGMSLSTNRKAPLQFVTKQREYQVDQAILPRL